MNKLTSRKFILALIAGISGVAISLSELGGQVSVICAIISALVPAVTYIITEGHIDAKAIDLSAKAAKDVIEIAKEAKEDGNDRSEAEE